MRHLLHLIIENRGNQIYVLRIISIVSKMPLWAQITLGFFCLLLAGVLGGWIEFQFLQTQTTPPPSPCGSPSAALAPTPPSNFRFIEVDAFTQGQPAWIVTSSGNCLTYVGGNTEHVNTVSSCDAGDRNQVFTYLPHSTMPRIQTNNSDGSQDCMGCDNHNCLQTPLPQDGILGANEGHASPRSPNNVATWIVSPNPSAGDSQFSLYQASLTVGRTKTDPSNAGCLDVSDNTISMRAITGTSPCGAANTQVFCFAVPSMTSYSPSS